MDAAQGEVIERNCLSVFIHTIIHCNLSISRLLKMSKTFQFDIKFRYKFVKKNIILKPICMFTRTLYFTFNRMMVGTLSLYQSILTNGADFHHLKIKFYLLFSGALSRPLASAYSECDPQLDNFKFSTLLFLSNSKLFYFIIFPTRDRRSSPLIT